MHPYHDQPCPKCNYMRRKSDTAPDWECPQCKVAYVKMQDHPETPKQSVATNTAEKAAKPGFRQKFKAIRISILVIILIIVSLDTWLAHVRATSWENTLRITVYPINGDGSAAAASFIASMSADLFAPTTQRLKEEAARYGVSLKEPVRISLSTPLSDQPPAMPAGQNILHIMWWSLKLRAWAYHVDNYEGPTANIKAFTLFFDPARSNTLQHSTGLKKGKISVINLFATPAMKEQNNTVFLHELLHTLGATDKYDLNSNLPVYPDGYAEPELQPLLPQRKAEIMAGRIPVTATTAEMPEHLADVIIGKKTAGEIGWSSSN